jgi:phosphatidylglycerophosphatase A
MDEQTETPASVTNLTTLLASGFGVGLSPVAPGTAGSLLGIACFYPLLGVDTSVQWLIFFVACAVAIASAERAGKAWGVIDHPAIVIDEVVGVWLAVLIPLSLLTFQRVVAATGGGCVLDVPTLRYREALACECAGTAVTRWLGGGHG